MGEANNYRNFEQKFTTPNSEFSDSEQLDLSLGLSLGGLYGRIPKEKPLIRASSLNGDLTLMNENEESWGFLSLARSASLPTEAENELRKLQALNRLVEKHRHSRGGSSQEEKPLLLGAKLSNWAIDSTSKDTVLCCTIEKLKSNVTPSANIKIEGPATLSQSTVTTRSLESGISVDSANYISEHVVTGTMANGKSAYPANHHSAPLVTLAKMASGKRVNSANSHADSVVSFMTRVNGKPVDQSAETEQERPSKKFKALANGIQDITMMEMMKLMPSVTTTGDGPNGKKIEGFLYRYKKGQVSIVCVCHGNFLSPAEFFRHAGGTDVANPMKHINVLPATL